MIIAFGLIQMWKAGNNMNINTRLITNIAFLIAIICSNSTLLETIGLTGITFNLIYILRKIKDNM